MKILIKENFLKRTINYLKELLIGVDVNKIDSKHLLRDLNTIHKFLIKNGIDLEQYPIEDANYIGQGHFGRVWKIKGKDLILKVSFGDWEELQKAKRIKDYQDKNNLKHFAKMYVLKELKYTPGSAIYIKELCYKLKPHVHDLLYYYLRELIKNDGKDIKLSERKDPIYIQALGIKNEMDKVGLYSLDLYGFNNIMQDKNGIYKVIDY